MPLNHSPPKIRPAAGRPSRLVRPPWAVAGDAGLRTQDVAGQLQNPQPLDNLMPPASVGSDRSGLRRVQKTRHDQLAAPAANGERCAVQKSGQSTCQPPDQKQNPPKYVRPQKCNDNRGAGPRCNSDVATINPQKIYVGDRAKIRGTPRVGEVMYVGPATFAHGKAVVGLKLDQKRTTSMCDGKYHGERYFRCQPGYGQYVPLADAEVLTSEPKDFKQPAPEAVGEAKGAETNLQKSNRVVLGIKHQKSDREVPCPSIPPHNNVGNLSCVQPPSRKVSNGGLGDGSPLDMELQKVIGLNKVKSTIISMRNGIIMQRKRAKFGPPQTPLMPMHAVNVFLGNPGSGKSTIAALLARMLHSMGQLTSDHVTEIDYKDLTSGGYHREDDTCAGMIRSARGGVLMINDAYKLIDERSRDSSGIKAVHTLVKECESRRKFVLILAGPRTPMQTFLRGAGSPLARIVTSTLEFPDLSADECALVARNVAASKGFTLDSNLTNGILGEIFRVKLRRLDTQNSNGVAVHSVVTDAIRSQTDRVHQNGTVSKSSLTTLLEEDFGETRSSTNCDGADDDINSVLTKLDKVTGLNGVKTFVHSMVATLELDQQRREVGMKPLNDSTLHMIFAGNPGTGKTTIARVVADMLRTLGVLRVGHLVEADRSSLVAGFVGQTALKTQEIVRSALGGVLFIDEAYALVSNEKDSFGREALDTLIKMVEDHRDDIVVILAGYKDEMENLLAHNPGVRSRFPTVIEFANYTAPELMEIFEGMMRADDLELAADARKVLMVQLEQMEKIADKENGNGRAMRNLLDAAKRRQALRLQKQTGRKTIQQLQSLTLEDIQG